MFSEVVEEVSDKESAPLGMIMIDLDKFKNVTIRTAIPPGRCVKSVTAELKRQVRPGDLVARYGGEEFIVLLKPPTVRRRCEWRTVSRPQIRNMTVKYNDNPIAITISQGVACWPEHCSDHYQLYESRPGII